LIIVVIASLEGFRMCIRWTALPRKAVFAFTMAAAATPTFMATKVVIAILGRERDAERSKRAAIRCEVNQIEAIRLCDFP
jgi:hypothetical protein